MNYDLLFSTAKKAVVEVAVIGVRGFNHSLVVYGSKSDKISIRVVCGRDTQKCRDAYRAIGIHDEMIEHCTAYEEGIKAFKKGRYLIFNDTLLAMRMPFDIAVEGTGNPEASAVHALAAIENGKHVVMVTKESDSVIGSLLSLKAREKGTILSLAEGDQPSLLVGLVTWARTAGLSILSIGKSSEYDFIYNDAERTMTVLDRTVAVPDFANVWHLGDDVNETLQRRSALLADFNQRALPDLTEMGIVCNHLPDFLPDVPAFHCPVARTVEIPEIMCPEGEGGILGGSPRIDVVNCLRRTDEQSLEGGVYVVVACDDEETWSVLLEKGVPISRSRKAALIYYPAHYLGFETVFSILSIGLLGIPTGSIAPRPRYDLVARACKPLAKGTRLEALGHHHVISGLEGLLLPAEPVALNRQLPYYLADRTVLKQDVQPGTCITAEMLVKEEPALLWTLRQEQDQVFFGP